MRELDTIELQFACMWYAIDPTDDPVDCMTVLAAHKGVTRSMLSMRTTVVWKERFTRFRQLVEGGTPLHGESVTDLFKDVRKEMGRSGFGTRIWLSELDHDSLKMMCVFAGIPIIDSTYGRMIDYLESTPHINRLRDYLYTDRWSEYMRDKERVFRTYKPDNITVTTR